MRNILENLKKFNLDKNTIVIFTSDNGPTHGSRDPRFHVGGAASTFFNSTGGLKGFKNTMWEGGLRVPAIIEWPAVIKSSISNYPTSTMDIFPTILDIVGISESEILNPIDGISIKPIFNSEKENRSVKIPFRFDDRGAMIDNNIKLVVRSIKDSQFELYNLGRDPKESNDISDENQEVFEVMKKDYLDWNMSVENSIKGNDYSNSEVSNDSFPKVWNTDERYKPYFNQWSKRPEYKNWIKIEK